MVKHEVIVMYAEDLEPVKEYALTLLKQLPDNPKTALIVIHYLEKLMEDEIGLKIDGIAVRQRDEV